MDSSFRRYWEFGRVICLTIFYVLMRVMRKENGVPLEVLVGLKVPALSGSNKGSRRVSQACEQHSGCIKANSEWKSLA